MGGIETYSYNLMNFFTDFDDVETIFPTKKKSEKIALRALSMIIFSISTLLKIFRKKYDVIHITNFNMWIIGYIYTFFNKNVKLGQNGHKSKKSALFFFNYLTISFFT